jgi:hypothetical protein
MVCMDQIVSEYQGGELTEGYTLPQRIKRDMVSGHCRYRNKFFIRLNRITKAFTVNHKYWCS